MLGITQILQGDVDDGIRMINDINHRLGELKLGFYEFSGHSFLAYAYLLKGERKAMKNHLEAAFLTMKSINFYSSLIWCHRVYNALAAIALELELDIDADHLRELIRRNRLAPPEDQHCLDNWPWPVKIYSLGRFVVRLEDKVIDTNSRPFDLLKVLLAFGGRDVNEEKIMDALWPEADGDQAQASFKTTLHRLRKVFGDLDALILKNHQLSLNDQYCWVDSRDLTRLFQRVHALANTTPDEPKAELATQLLQIYKGHFLANESASWAIQQRESLRQQFVRQVNELSHHLESQAPVMAISCYQRLLEIDPFIETAYQGLIRTYQQLGRQAEAQASYRQCKELLSTVGVQPSEATNSLVC